MGAGASVPDGETRFTDEEKELMKDMPMGHDLTLVAEHDRYMKLAGLFYKKDLDALRAIEKDVAETQEKAFKYPTMFRWPSLEGYFTKLLSLFFVLRC